MVYISFKSYAQLKVQISCDLCISGDLYCIYRADGDAFSVWLKHSLYFESNWLGIGFAAFVAVIASLNLILDFDLIETNAAYRAPKFMEWLCGIALLATLVWMYISFLRLLGLLSDD